MSCLASCQTVPISKLIMIWNCLLWGEEFHLCWEFWYSHPFFFFSKKKRINRKSSSESCLQVATNRYIDCLQNISHLNHKLFVIIIIIKKYKWEFPKQSNSYSKKQRCQRSSSVHLSTANSSTIILKLNWWNLRETHDKNKMLSPVISWLLWSAVIHRRFAVVNSSIVNQSKARIQLQTT